MIDPLTATCPVPGVETERVLLGHGSGGQLSAGLIAGVIGPALGAASPGGPLQDAAVLDIGGLSLVMTTDSFVVTPRFFPGGDIGMLAVHGTINDVAMMGAWPAALSLAYVIEEGFPLDELRRITESVGRAALAAGVPVVTGDTKVVGRGAADGVFVNTTGIGMRLPGVSPDACGAKPGDAVLLSGPIGLHGVTILSVREGLGFEAEIASDTQPLHRLVRRLLEVAPAGVHVLRDPTRGGLASSLNELAVTSGIGVEIDEPALPVPETVASACEMLGLDPLHVANEGCLVAFVALEAVDSVLAAMHEFPEGEHAVRIGEAVEAHPGQVLMRTLMGSHRVVDMLIGEQLPRIC